MAETFRNIDLVQVVITTTKSEAFYYYPRMKYRVKLGHFEVFLQVLGLVIKDIKVCNIY